MRSKLHVAVRMCKIKRGHSKVEFLFLTLYLKSRRGLIFKKVCVRKSMEIMKEL